jgi:hypothetical protein
MSSEIRILVDANGFCMHIPCCMCGESFEPDDPQPCLADERWQRLLGRDSGGDLCPRCFDTLDLHGAAVLADDLERDIELFAVNERERIATVVASVRANAALLRASTVTIRRTGRTLAGIDGMGCDAPATEME